VILASHAVRFLHVSDLHLERTLGGLVSVPNRLRDDFIDATFQGAENAFQAALGEKVDFVLLAGDIIDVETAGPRAIDFLLTHLQRLEEHLIPVYWAGGEVDKLDDWPTEVPLPKSVHVFPLGGVEEFQFKRKDRTVATIRGQSYRSGQPFRAADYAIRAEGPSRIAMAYIPECETITLREQAVDYWALGGHHQAMDLAPEMGIARFSGNPQGLGPDEFGPHSCTIVQIELGRARLQTIETDVLRWRKERIELPADADRRDLTQAIRHRLKEIRPDRAGLLTLVRWSISCHGSLSRELRQDTVRDSVLASISDASGDSNVVSVLIEPEDRPVPADRFEEETILGDFLRKVRELEQDHGRVIDLIEYLPESPVKHELVSLVRLSTPAEHKRILERAIMLGMEFLDADADVVRA
jgi:DNA repair exonuclease SbcCD nuclease subunit